MSSKGILLLKVVSPIGNEPPIECDSARFTLSDNEKNGGGSYGVRPGHTKALFLLAAGRIEALRKGEKVYSADCKGGFASVENDVLTIVLD